MPKTLSEVTRDAAELPVAERLKLARILLDISETDAEPISEIEMAWEAEIERRLEDLRSGKVKGVPLDEAKRRIESGL